MGGSDTLAQAKSFATTYGGPANMLWGESFEAWRHYNTGNPTLILLDGAGVQQIEKISGFNASRLQDALDSLT
ncbi:MAG: hypothetical protein F4Y12_14565 [Acidimicrobiaceae bacterium]|nr:hypothetical protein [Acidimicrobiaceae bacterium]MYH78956.1 hypothetical protein [Acidimicrobiaceae bacterium]MYK76270.1 hypothetical protein [Acidimicrobiaceae bacterium]